MAGIIYGPEGLAELVQIVNFMLNSRGHRSVAKDNRLDVLIKVYQEKVQRYKSVSQAINFDFPLCREPNDRKTIAYNAEEDCPIRNLEKF